MLNFSKSGHHVFRGSSALERGELKSKKEKTVEAVLRMIISVNQLSIYQTVADTCDELACKISGCSENTGKLVAKARQKQTSIPTTSSPTVTLPDHLREWIDVEPAQYDKSCFEVSEKMIRWLRHDPSAFREEDGAVEFRTLAQNLRLLSTGQFEHG